MKPVLFVLLVLNAGLLLAQTPSIDEVDKTPVEARFAAGGKLRMELCPGGVRIDGTENDRIRVSYESRKDRTDVEVKIQETGDQAYVRVSHCPHNNFEMAIEVPKQADLHVRMLAGQMDVHGITGDKDIELHYGQLTIDLGEPADYGHVDGSVVSGDLEAGAFDVSKGGLFRSFEHNGTGKYRLHAHVGAGQLELH